MIKINHKKDNMYENMLYEFINGDLIMKWFIDRCGDLYWTLYIKEISFNDEYDFKVGIQNYKLYCIIEKIYNDFKDGEIFYHSEIDEELKYNAVNWNRNQYIRNIAREIYNNNTNEVVWDNNDDVKSYNNKIRIIKNNNQFIIRFSNTFHGKLIRICFKKNSGYYGPCSLPFFRAYDQIDKIKDNYETTFEEYFESIRPVLQSDGSIKTYSKKNEI